MKQIRAIIRTLFSLALVWFGVATATFFLMRAVPGGPLSRERKLPEAVAKAIAAEYHLDDPIWLQYVRYLGEAARFRFGPSYDDPGQSVGSIIARRLPRSMALGALAMAISLVVAFPLGTMAAMKRGGWADRSLAVMASAGVSVPSFILGSLLLYLFAYRLKLFPAGGWESGLRAMPYMILPALSLAALPTAYLGRLIRAGLAEVMQSEFLLTARAKGLSRGRAVVVHALRHTMAPVLAYLGPQAAAVMTGSFVVEKIFNVPGMGMMYVQSIGNRNYPMIMGATLVYTVMLVAFNILGDLASRMLDPRLRTQS